METNVDSIIIDIMTSSKGSIFRVTVPVCEEFTSGFPWQMNNNADFWCFFVVVRNKLLNKHSFGRYFETPWPSFDVAAMRRIDYYGFFLIMTLAMTWRIRPLQLVLSGGPVTITPTIEYNENTMDWEVKIGVHSRASRLQHQIPWCARNALMGNKSHIIWANFSTN